MRTEECEMIYLQFYMLIFAKMGRMNWRQRGLWAYNEGRDCRFLSWAAKLVVVPWGLWLQKELNHFWHAELQGPDGVSTHKYAAGTGLLSEAHEGNAGCTDGSGNTHMKENSPWEHAACRGKTEVGILISARTAGRGIYQVDEKELLDEKKDSEHFWWFSG